MKEKRYCLKLLDQLKKFSRTLPGMHGSEPNRSNISDSTIVSLLRNPFTADKQTTNNNRLQQKPNNKNKKNNNKQIICE